jgi:hypothetical protein
MKLDHIDIDDTESNEDWIKEVTRKREKQTGSLIRTTPGESEETTKQ